MFVGVMTGTSVDGLDIAAIEIDIDEKIEFIASETTAYLPTRKISTISGGGG